MAFALFVAAWVARYLGRELYGVYNYGLAFVGLFAPLAYLGLQSMVVRELVREPGARDEILGTTFVLRLAGGAVCAVLAIAAVSIVRSGDELVRLVTWIVAGMLVFQPMETVDLWFQSQVRSKYTVLAKSGAMVIGYGLRIAAVLAGASVVVFAGISVADSVLAGVFLLAAYRISGLRIARWTFSWSRARSLLSESWALVISGALAVVYFKIDQVMLGEMVSEEEVGVYSTAVRLSEVWYFIPVAITTSVFPALIRSRERGVEIYHRRLQQLYDFYAWLALLVAVFFTFASRWVIVLVFGEQYSAAGPILALHIWSGVFIFLKVALSSWLLNESRLKFLFLSSGLGAAVNVGLNLWLIPAYGGMGAAVATIASYACAGWLACFLYRPAWLAGWMITKALVVPLRAAAALPGRLMGRGGGEDEGEKSEGDGGGNGKEDGGGRESEDEEDE